MINLDTPIARLPRVQPKYIKALKKLGILNARDLVFHFPFRYDDYSRILKIRDITDTGAVTVEGIVTQSRTTRTWKKRMCLTEVVLEDDSGKIKALWFNQPYLADQLREGKKIRVSGIVRNSNSSGRNNRQKSGLFKSGVENFYFSNPVWELSSRAPTNTGRLVPVYPETEGLTSRWLRWQIQILLKSLPTIQDPLPAEMLKRLHLPEISKALRWIHFPDTLNHALVAQKRFAFEEMFLLQLKSLQIRIVRQREGAIKIRFDKKLIGDFIAKLPFELTDAQRKSSFEILRDLEKTVPMNRLLNGDVGSGKTMVAAVASLQVANAGYQVVIMAPTEVLAHQHFETFSRLFANYGLNIALLTNSYKLFSCRHDFALARDTISSKELKSGILTVALSRNDILKKIRSGKVNLVIGTHALIQEGVRFKNLVLVIVDEQHRFGVDQRAYLQQKASEINDGLIGKIPHFLTMTATPIPRTLALAFFGNLDISFLNEMPVNRKKVITQVVERSEREETYNFVRQEVKKGRQCFVVLSLVEESKILAEVKAATQEYNRLSREVFFDLRLGLVHGRLKPAEKEKALKDFAERKTDILVATPVVEVGIDIPNATIMIIEDADRFGLSQLHQFRGRIGRGGHQSYCFLFTSSNSTNVRKRLETITKNTDGFKIAEKDLELRGPGEFLGTRQSGIPDIAVKNIANVKLVQIAREEARLLLKNDADFRKNPGLKTVLQRFNQKIHLE